MSSSSEFNVFSATSIGAIEVKNRIAIAVLGQIRADRAGVHSELAVEYYRQRASAGLIIGEATGVSRDGRGSAFMPGIYSDVHVAAWRRITSAVHEGGGKIVCQLSHLGRVAPQAMDEPRMARLLESYRHAACCAAEAGFDGVEVEAASGGLLDQFLCPDGSRMLDSYGGTPVRRARLPVQVIAAVAEVWGPGRVGVRLSPAICSEAPGSLAESAYLALAEQLGRLGLAYLHCIEDQAQGGAGGFNFQRLHALFGGKYITSNSQDYESALGTLRAASPDMVAFGRSLISSRELELQLQRYA